MQQQDIEPLAGGDQRLPAVGGAAIQAPATRRRTSAERFVQLDAQLRTLLGDPYRAIRQRLEASSAVENYNSRLRCYFFLRREEVGPDYLELLRFILNHHRYARSRKDHRAGKSPAEILAGKTLPHWLEQLGFTLFRQPDRVAQAAEAA